MTEPKTEAKKRIPGVPDAALEKAIAIANEYGGELAIDWPEIETHGEKRKCTRLTLVGTDFELIGGNNTLLLAELMRYWRMGK